MKNFLKKLFVTFFLPLSHQKLLVQIIWKFFYKHNSREEEQANQKKNITKKLSGQPRQNYIESLKK